MRIDAVVEDAIAQGRRDEPLLATLRAVGSTSRAGLFEVAGV